MIPIKVIPNLEYYAVGNKLTFYLNNPSVICYLNKNAEITTDKDEAISFQKPNEDYILKLFPRWDVGDTSEFEVLSEKQKEFNEITFGISEGLIVVHGKSKKFRSFPLSEPYQYAIMSSDGNTILLAKDYSTTTGHIKLFIVDNPFAELT